jgi:hypothetical protein
VIIDRHSLRDSRWWVVISLITLFLATLGYKIYAARAVQGPSGGSWPGLVLGAAGTAIIVFAWALTLRKWRRAARIGRAYTWLQGHVYLSLVSYPIILYHAGFHLGGPLTTALMWAFTICYASGILLLIMQQVVPRLLLAKVPLETIYDQIDRVSALNLAAADNLVESHTAATRVAATVPDLEEDDLPAAGAARSPAANAAWELQLFYNERVRPYLAARVPTADRAPATAILVSWAAGARRILLPTRGAALPTADEFAEIRRKLPTLSGVIDALEGYTAERRQFTLQARLQHILNFWLLVHVPAAWIMMILLPLHIIMAIRYL